jgi:hypothetical protein
MRRYAWSKNIRVSTIEKARRTICCLEAAVIQKLPGISIEMLVGPGRECSRVKSSIKVSLLADGPDGLISEGLTLSACFTGLNEGRLLLRFADRRLSTSRFLGRLIAAPAAPLRT